MNPRNEQVIAVALELAEARGKVEELEARLDYLLRGGEHDGKVVTLGEPARAKAARAKAADRSKPAPGRRGENAVKAEALARDGMSPTEIAGELGIEARAVNQMLWRARKAGRLPKAEASR